MKKHPFLMSLTVAVGAAFTFTAFCPSLQAAVTIYYSGLEVADTFTPPGPKTNFATLPNFTNPQGLVFDTSNNLYVAGSGNVHKINPGGVVSLFATLPAFGGTGMVIDPNNNLYVAGAASLEIKKITPGGSVSTYATLASGSTGLAIDTSGNLYVVGGGQYTIRKIPSGGGAATIYATLGGNNLYGLAFDSFGYLYASDLTKTNLYKIPPGGGSYVNFGTLSSGVKGLAFDTSGNLYGTQPNESKICMITPAGNTTTFAINLNSPRYLTFKPGPPFVLLITAVEKISSDLRLSFTSQTGNSYAIQSRTNLSSGTWATLAGTTNSGTGSIVQQTLTNAFTVAQQFYRVQQLP
jgi:sugar lactone lactonase YvrE